MTYVESQISAQALLKRTDDAQGKQRGAGQSEHVRAPECVDSRIPRYTYGVRRALWVGARGIEPGGACLQAGSV